MLVAVFLYLSIFFLLTNLHCQGHQSLGWDPYHDPVAADNPCEDPTVHSVSRAEALWWGLQLPGKGAGPALGLVWYRFAQHTLWLQMFLGAAGARQAAGRDAGFRVQNLGWHRLHPAVVERPPP